MLVATTSAACGAEENDAVSVGVIPIVDVAPIYLGEEQGFFSDRGIELDLTPAQGGAAILPGVQEGQFQFGFTNVISVFLAQAGGFSLRIVSNGNNTSGVDGEDFGGLVVAGDSPIRTPADLADPSLRVATNTLDNIVSTVVHESVRQDGGEAADVRFTELPFDQMPAALDAGRVDAVFVVEPFLTMVLDGGGRLVASSYVDTTDDLTVAVYVTSTELIENDPDLVDRFSEAMAESLAYAADNPDEVRRILPEYAGIEPELAERIRLPSWPPEVNAESFREMAELARTDGLLDAPADVDALLP